MEITNELLVKAKAAKSTEELIAIAKENGVELTEEEAAKYFAELHKDGELADNELDNVSGGCGGSSKPNPKYKVGQQVLKVYTYTVDRGEIISVLDYNSQNGYLYRVHMNDGKEFVVYLETNTDYIVR